jgi:hypothetical protein
MKKFVPLILLLILALSFTGFAQEKRSAKSAGTGKSKVKKKADDSSCGLPPSVFALRLSHSRISGNCPAQDGSCSAGARIDVAATSIGVDASQYVYAIDAGKVVGIGANVVWDLTGVKPGEYSITAGIDTGTHWGVLGKTITRVVRIVDCADCETETSKTPDN